MENIFKEGEEKESKGNQTVIKFTPILESLEKLKKIAEEPKEISNFDEVKLHLRTELKILYDNLAKMFGGLKIPDSFKIEGIPKYPDEVSIKDVVIQVAQLQNLLDSITDLRTVLAQIDFKPQIEIKHDYPDINIPPIKVPEVRIPEIKVPKPEVTVNSEIDLSELLGALKPLRLLSDKATRPLSVRLSDGANFIKKLTEIVGQQEKWVTAFSQSKGMDEGEFKNKFTQLTQATTIISNRKAVTNAGTAEKLIATATPCFRVDICADIGNTNAIVVGGSGVVAASGLQKGTVLLPGEIFTVFIDDVSKIYVDSIVNLEGVCFNYYTR